MVAGRRMLCIFFFRDCQTSCTFHYSRAAITVHAESNRPHQGARSTLLVILCVRWYLSIAICMDGLGAAAVLLRLFRFSPLA